MACHYGHLIICVALSHLMQDNKTALYMACESGHIEVAATLLKHGANIDKGDMVSLRMKRSCLMSKTQLVGVPMGVVMV